MSEAEDEYTARLRRQDEREARSHERAEESLRMAREELELRREAIANELEMKAGYNAYLSRIAAANERQAAAWGRIATSLEKIAEKA